MNRHEAFIDRKVAGWIGIPSVSRKTEIVIVGQVGFALVGDVLYVRLLCPCKRVRGAA